MDYQEIRKLAERIATEFSEGYLVVRIQTRREIYIGIKVEQGSVAWQTSYRQIEDYWCIGRKDGTLVSFVIPRSVLVHQGTVKRGNVSQSFSVNRSDV